MLHSAHSNVKFGGGSYKTQQRGKTACVPCLLLVEGMQFSSITLSNFRTLTPPSCCSWGSHVPVGAAFGEISAAEIPSVIRDLPWDTSQEDCRNAE